MEIQFLKSNHSKKSIKVLDFGKLLTISNLNSEIEQNCEDKKILYSQLFDLVFREKMSPFFRKLRKMMNEVISKILKHYRSFKKWIWFIGGNFKQTIVFNFLIENQWIILITVEMIFKCKITTFFIFFHEYKVIHE